MQPGSSPSTPMLSDPSPAIDIRLRNMIARNEGLRLRIYEDSLGIPTIGYGINLLEGLSEPECEYLLINRIKVATNECKKRFDWFDSIGEGRQHALIDLTYNMGIVRLLGFRKMLTALSQGEFARASMELLDSRYARQVGIRADRNAYLMLRNEYPDK